MTDTGVSLPNPALRALHRRGVEAAIWGIPAVNYRMMYEASAAVGGLGDNQLVYWPGLLNWENQTLTPSNRSGQQARGGFQGLPVMASRSASRTLSPCFPTVEM